MIKGVVNSIESFGSVDGPGVRFMFFMQGCNMRCAYCHNPETWAKELPDTSESMVITPEEGFKMASRYKAYWKKGGGITVSGGEAMLQMEWVTELFKICRKNGVTTALDTSGSPFDPDNAEYMKKFEEMFAVTDLFILDLKEYDDARHKKLTGCSNRNILALARYISDHGGKMWIRHVLVPGVTDQEDDLKALSDFIKSLHGVDRVEILPYHTLGVTKYEKLGIPYRLEGVPTPTDEQVRHAQEILHTEDYQGFRS